MGDFALIWDGGSADMGLVDDDVAADEGLRTAVLLSLFTDRRAEEGDVLPGDDDDLRGHWGDEFLPDPDDKIGSRLWLLERSKITGELVTRAELYVREALAWMIADGVVEEIIFEAEIVGDRLYYLITLERPEGDPARFRFAHAWDGEAARSVPGVPIPPLLIAAFPFIEPVTAFDFSSEFATDEWLLQETSGSYANNAGTEALTNSGGIQGQMAAGLFDGDSHVARKAWETDTNSDNCASVTSAPLDSNNEDLCVRVVFRADARATSGGRFLAKRQPSPFNGWDLIISSGGGIQVTIDDGANTEIASTGVAGYDDGAWHWAMFFYDKSEDTLQLISDLADSPVEDVSAVVGSITATDTFRLGTGAATPTSGAVGVQIAYCGGAVGAAAADMFAEDFWVHATDPTGLLDPPDRGSSLGLHVAAAAVSIFADDTLPIGYDPALTETRLGLYCGNPATNLVPYSEVSTGAANTNITPTDNAADAPSGFKRATTLLSTAAPGDQARTCVTVGETLYSGTAFIEEVTAGVAGRVIMWDETHSAQLGATPFVGTGSPQRIEVIASTIAGGISTSMRVEVTADAETVIAWAWQLEEGSSPGGAIIRTDGAAASTVQSDYRATGDHVQEKTGELEAVFVLKKLPPTGDLHYVYDTNAAADRRALYVDDAGAVKFIAGNSAGGTVATITLGTAVIDTEYTASCQWDAAAGLDGSSVRGKLNALARVAGGASFTSGGAFTAEISIGASDTTADTALDGFIAHINSYDGPRAMAV